MTTRRSFLEAAASVGALRSSQSGEPGSNSVSLPKSQIAAAVLQAQTRAHLTAWSGLETGTVAALSERGREGVFVLRAGDAPPDPRQGLYVRSNAAGFYWQRIWDGTSGRPQWFGAVTGTIAAAAENRAALQACLDLCPTMQLDPGDYYIDGPLNVTKNGTGIRGSGHTQTDQTDNDDGRSCRIFSTSARDTIINVGADSKTKPRDLTETVHLEGFTVDRAVNPFTPTAGYEGAIGIALRWCVNCHLDRVLSLNSARGFFYYGVVETYTRFCSALRSREGSDAGNDCFIGFHFDYSAPSGYNGGNASVYLIYCRAFPLTEDRSPDLTYSAGIRFDGGWVDCSIHGFESGAGIAYGIHGIGDGFDAASFRTENLIVTNCLLDSNSKAGISLEQGGSRSAITISNCYIAASNAACIVLDKIAGAVTISDCQQITGTFGSSGLIASEVSGLRSHGNIYTLLRQPIRLTKISGFHIADTIQGQSANGDSPAIDISACRHGKIDCIVRGPTGSYSAGINFSGIGSRAVEVCATAIDPHAFSDRRSAVVHEGDFVVTPGRFGGGCLLAGILSE